MTELGSVYWVGGGSGGGKSTVASALARTYGLTLYSTDNVMADHVRRCDQSQTPLLQRFLAMDMDERWVNRPPSQMLAEFHWFAGEGFDLIIDDLRALVAEGNAVLAEGFRLLPNLVAPWLEDGSRAVWLLPSDTFREAAFDARGSTWDIPGRTSNPDRALSNLLERDGLFTERLLTEVDHLGLACIPLDLPCPVDDLIRRVADLFGLDAG